MTESVSKWKSIAKQKGISNSEIEMTRNAFRV